MDPAYPYALPAGTDIGGFRLVRVLGAGGFGITYEAISPFTGRRWAIKEFFPQGFASRDEATRVVYSPNAADIIERALTQYERSTKKLCELDHPNIIKVIHYIQHNATGYMVMDYVEGQTFDTWLREQDDIPSPSELKPILDEVFDALEYAHSRNTVHRDIAPDNIIIRSDGRPVIIDFGALKVLDPQTSVQLSSLIVRKRFYSPPEQSEGGDVRPSADVYALAAVLYRAFTGSPPADAEDRKNAIAFGRKDPYEPLDRREDMPLPRATRRAIDRALSFHAADRPQSVRAFREGLNWEGPTSPVPRTVSLGGQVELSKGASGVRRSRVLTWGIVAATAVLAGTVFLLALRGTQIGTKQDAGLCGAQQLEAATAGSEEGLGKFLASCPSGPSSVEARRRLDTRIDEREIVLARDAGFDMDKLQAYLASCSRCTARLDVQARIALIRAEDTAYREATGSIERLEAYAKQCKACLHRSEALRTAAALRESEKQAAARSKADEDAYRAAKGSIERLENYANTCDVCRFRDDALREVDALRQSARAKADEEAYVAARGSIERLENYARTCDLCRYRTEALNEAARLRQANRPQPPMPLIADMQRPINNLFSAWRKLDLADYLAQWAPEATRIDLKSGRRTTFNELAKDRARLFEQLASVDANYRATFRNFQNGIGEFDVSYSMTFRTRAGRTFSERACEAYKVRQQALIWVIVENQDYKRVSDKPSELSLLLTVQDVRGQALREAFDRRSR